MAKKDLKTQENIDISENDIIESVDEEQNEIIKQLEDEKAEIIGKIEAVLKAKEDEIEEAAEQIAPEFDYEQAAEELKQEEYDLIKAAEERRIQAAKEREAAAHVFIMPPAEVSPSRYPKEKFVPKTALGRVFLKDRHRMVLGITILALIATVAWQVIDYAIPENVRITYRTISDVRKENIKTRARTVGELKDELVSKGYDIADEDAVIPVAEMPVKNNMSVRIMKATASTAKVAGNKRQVFLIAGTVKDNLEYNDITYDDDDEIKPSLDKMISEKTKIVVNEVHYVTREKTEKVKAVNKVILDPKLGSGIEERTEGNDGKGVFTYTYKYVNGKKTDTEKEVKEWIKEPHDNTLRLGTSSTGNKGEYEVVRTFTANCTAYTAPAGARGSLGQRVHVGTCAVDPSYVPYRSEMWIAGYGYAYANDCGGAVKGNVVDLYMNTTRACIQWGRRNMTAYILKPVN